MHRKSSESWPRTRYVLKDHEAIAQHFPDPNVTLLSPAFLWPETIPPGFKEGTSAPTDEGTLDLFLSLLAERNHWMVYNPSDFQSEAGRDIPYLLLSSSNLDLDINAETNSCHPTPKLRIWIQGSAHGDEPGSEQAVLAFLGKLDSDPTWTTSLLEKVEILVLPRYNADGACYASRHFASDINPARDNICQTSRQTTSIKALYNSFSPHVSIDMHEFGARYRYLGGRYVQAVDGQFAVAKNLNIAHEIRHLSETLFTTGLGKALNAANLRWQPYAVGNSYQGADVPLEFVEAGGDAKITRNAWGLTQSIAFLCEARGIGIADQHFARRTYTGLVMLVTIVDISAGHVDDILATLDKARHDFVNGRDDIVVTDTRTEGVSNGWQDKYSHSHSHPSPSPHPRPFIDTTTGALIHLDMKFLSSNPLLPVITRKRPKAYIIPPSPAQKLIVSKLSSLGLYLLVTSEPMDTSGENEREKRNQQDSVGVTTTVPPAESPHFSSKSTPITIPNLNRSPLTFGDMYSTNDQLSPSSTSRLYPHHPSRLRQSISSGRSLSPPSISSSLSPHRIRKRIMTTVTTSIAKTDEIPRGSFVLDTRQKNAGLAFMALEPESEASFATSGILDGVMEEDEEEENGEENKGFVWRVMHDLDE
ncbi:hypothetical protein PV10_00508 [Exophiala mesophila]|uniref:Peptidase M14 domain-containing protein n=1 Tax=Exophiala mesophila TaxID=212818 RepID=A0A0D1ZRT9_EXOME|nr:uncharacterized protein PV10_00508 [Exophiala mesophila]KIV96674.1 hypothetical protein PV10_00508 [Exophiala mesophila]